MVSMVYYYDTYGSINMYVDNNDALNLDSHVCAPPTVVSFVCRGPSEFHFVTPAKRIFFADDMAVQISTTTRGIPPAGVG